MRTKRAPTIPQTRLELELKIKTIDIMLTVRRISITNQTLITPSISR